MNPTREQIEALIDKLANKELTKKCTVSLSYEARGRFKLNDRMHEIYAVDEANDKFLLEVSDHKNDSLRQEGIACWIEKDWIGNIIGHPVYIGAVLKDLYDVYLGYFRGFDNDEDTKKLFDLWGTCGFTKSLQEIMEDSGFETGAWSLVTNGKIVEEWQEQLECPNAAALFTFLIDIL